MLPSAINFIIGILLLFFAAEIIVNGSVRFAEFLHVRPFIIGITVISFASSLPEFFISLISLYHQHPDFMIGNVIGSNIANLGLILPVAFFLKPNRKDENPLSRDIIVMYCATALLILFLRNGTIDRIEGVILFGACLAYNISLINSSKLKKSTSISHLKTAKLFVRLSLSHWHCLVLIIAGLIGLSYAAKIIVTSAVDIAKLLGISNFIISTSVVAVATALPELGMAIVSALKNQKELLLGNIIGSNIYNLLFVTGFSTIFFPVNLTQESVTFKLIALAFFSLFLLPFINWEKVSRLLSALFFLVYVGYILLLYTV